MVPSLCCSQKLGDPQQQDSAQACASDCRPFASVSLVVECCGVSQRPHGQTSVRSRLAELESTPRILDPVPLDSLIQNADDVDVTTELPQEPLQDSDVTFSPKASCSGASEESAEPMKQPTPVSADAPGGLAEKVSGSVHVQLGSTIKVSASDENTFTDAADEAPDMEFDLLPVVDIEANSQWVLTKDVDKIDNQLGQLTFDIDDLDLRQDDGGEQMSCAGSRSVTASAASPSRRISQNTQASKMSKGSKSPKRGWRWSLRSGASWKSWEGQAVGQIPLQDMLLIIIGHGQEAELLARRRLQAGGRTCLLWTDRPPRNDARNPQADPGNCGASDLFWKPPELGYQDDVDPDIKRLRASLGAGITREYFKAGPDIVPLARFQEYDLISGKAGQRVGLRVWDRGRVKASSKLVCERIRWELSGAVVFAGRMHPRVFGGKDGSSQMDEVDTLDLDRVRALDVSIDCEDAKSHFRVQPFTMIFWSLYNLVGLALTLAIPFGCSVGPRFLGYALAGCTTPMYFEFFGVLVAALAFGSLATLSLDEENGIRNQMSMTGVVVLGLPGYLLIMLPLHMVWCWLGLGKMPLRLCKHAAWTLWLLIAILGGWALMYVISLGYCSLARDLPIVAGLLLPLTTCGFEGFTALVTSKVYDRSVYTARMGPDCIHDIHGDQKLPYMGVIMIAHAYAESTRMVCLLVHAIEEQTYVWIFSLLLGMVVNILARRGWISSFMCRACPDYLISLVIPTSSMKVYDHAKISFGFLRFIAPLALGIARAAGSGEAPFFGSPGLEVLIASLVVAILENLLLYFEFIPYAKPSEREKQFYMFLSPFDPGQIFARSKDTPCVFRGLLLHGLRPAGAREVGGFVSIASMISVCLLEFLLGAGYIYGVCQERLPTGQRVANSFIWQTPLSCK